MKISFRILLINFTVVVIILLSAATVFYSLIFNTLNSQQTKNLINSSNSFIYTFQKLLSDLDDDLLFFLEGKGQNKSGILNSKSLDFVIQAKSDESTFENFYLSNNVFINPQVNTIQKFLEINPLALVKKKSFEGKVYFYGKILNLNFIEDISQRINAEVAIIWENSAAEISNPTVNREYLYLINTAYNYLKNKNSFEIYTQGTKASDILATLYKTNADDLIKSNIAFLIFNKMGEAATLRDTLKNVLFIIGFVGIIISLILSYLLTNKIRKQIGELSSATEQIRNGSYNIRVPVKGKDEVAKLGDAFNLMLDEIVKNQKEMSDYTEFITLINQNPSLKEISDAALKKIINTCGFTVGAIYSVDDNEINFITSFGLGSNKIGSENNIFYKKVLETKEPLTIESDNFLPVASTGIFDIKIKYLHIRPVIYSNKVIAILEFGSTSKPSDEAVKYLSKIQDQLAVGLTNAKAFVQLENFVNELSRLNEEMQKQNEQIKRQNETLIKLSEQLKEKAKELEIQKEKAEESTKLKSQFLASMSHELRTPMNSILGLTELILDKAQLDDKNRERLEVVLKSGKRLMNLINDILDLSKIEAGKMEIREEEILLEELIEDVAATIQPLVNEKGLRFTINRKCDTRLIITTDKGRVSQILINLLGNAVKFTDRGNVELSVASTDDNFIVFSVSDTGIGIPDEAQKIIFEEFRQVDGSTARRYSGTGLGLAISKKIIDLLGGKIWVKSIVGKGSIFSFTIPIHYRNESLKKENEIEQLGFIKQYNDKPILVIDDDSDVRFTIGQYLTTRGYEVIFASNAETGIKLATEHKPFAITLDVMLPDKDGWCALKELKENPETKDIPVILVSFIGDNKIGLGLGAFDYLVKPITSENLLNAFDKLEATTKRKIQKIVIVDDDELEFEKFKRAFKSDNITIEYIQDSEYAFNKIAEVQPDLIIIDLIMPKVDGITLTHKLKNSPLTKNIPVIISTAKDLTVKEKQELNSIVEHIAIKSQGHPMDVLKIVRDRIKQQEETKYPKNLEVISKTELTGNTKNTVDSKQKDKEEILIVDDDPDTLFTMNEIVQSLGYKTYLAKSGIECLKMLDHIKPDLILLDIMMPGMDGFQTLKNIRSIKKMDDVPVYAVTAKAMAGDKEIILKNGFNDYIPKPVNSTIISTKISQLFLKTKSSSV
ncbi:response regulator [Ignavibacterium sp.]|uniref:response regulator n=1 Tax=Ignavibacterium sp. TaxID=2651167 RepID=UPI00307CEDDA